MCAISEGRDHSARNSRACVAGGLSAVVRVGVENDRAATDPMFAVEVKVREAHLGIHVSFGVRLHVSKVACVSGRSLRESVVMTVWVEVAASARPIRRRAVSCLVHVEPMSRSRLEPCERYSHAHLARLLRRDGGIGSHVITDDLNGRLSSLRACLCGFSRRFGTSTSDDESEAKAKACLVHDADIQHNGSE